MNLKYVRWALALSAIPVLGSAEPLLGAQHHETLIEASPELARIRYVMPELAAGFDLAAISDKLMTLCNTHAAPIVSESHPEIRQIIVSVMQSPFEFGDTRPDIPQAFESFELVDGTCVWGEI